MNLDKYFVDIKTLNSDHYRERAEMSFDMLKIAVDSANKKLIKILRHEIRFIEDKIKKIHT